MHNTTHHWKYQKFGIINFFYDFERSMFFRRAFIWSNYNQAGTWLKIIFILKILNIWNKITKTNVNKFAQTIFYLHKIFNIIYF